MNYDAISSTCANVMKVDDDSVVVLSSIVSLCRPLRLSSLRSRWTMVLLVLPSSLIIHFRAVLLDLDDVIRS